ncbi:hypothetical protein EGY25_03890 [Brevundimonas intermedia]|uniref:Uncharacterized protein n=1 Tax=Brevundimonas intermedia TaxID=74315 RepID=A0A4Y9S498_9CAUL|nr:hypothetical protein [Brevundimonas intermedia]TFW14348.1 hypothetical protein EGY25_03890 [Brevundimonas intermedia]
MMSALAAALTLFSMQDAPPQDVQAGERSPVEQPSERRICRREHVVGSNRPKRICMTERQWRQVEDDSREQHQNMTRGQPMDVPRMPG